MVCFQHKISFLRFARSSVHVLIFFLCLAIGGGGCGGGSRGTGFEVNGTLTSKQTGAALAGVQVTIVQTGESTITDASGKFALISSFLGGDLVLSFENKGIRSTFTVEKVPATASGVTLRLSIDENDGSVSDNDVDIIDDDSGDSGNSSSANGNSSDPALDPQRPEVPSTPTPTPTPVVVPTPVPTLPPTQTPTATPAPTGPDTVLAPTVESLPALSTNASLTARGSKSPGTGIVLNGSLVITPNESSSWALTLSLQEGSNSIAFAAQNSSGTRSSTVSASIILDTINPSITVAAAQNVTTNSADIQVTVSETSLINLTITPAVAQQTNGLGRQLVVALTGLQPATHYSVGVRVSDQAGHEASSSFSFDTLTPAPVAQTEFFWSDVGGQLAKTSVDSRSNTQVLSGLNTPRSVSFDPVEDKLYWADYGKNKIQRSNLNGSAIETVVDITTADAKVLSIAIDTVRRKLYWVTCTFPITSSNPSLTESNLDGTSRVSLPVGSLRLLDSLQFDPVEQKLYFTDLDSIYRINSDGTNLSRIYQTANLTPTIHYGVGAIALNVTGRQVYWFDYGDNSIRRANLDGTNVGVVLAADLNAAATAMTVNPVEGKIYWARAKVWRVNLDGSNRETLYDPGPSPATSFTGLTLDLTRGKVYLSEELSFQKKILRMDLDGNNFATLDSSLVVSPFGVKIDSANGYLYWRDGGTASINRSRLDGSSPEVLRQIANGGSGSGVALDAANGWLFWSEDWNSNTGTVIPTKIRRSRLDGTGVQDVVLLPGASWVHDIEFNPDDGKIYWSYFGVYRANPDGTNMETLLSDTANTIRYLDLDRTNAKIYFTETTESGLAVGTLNRFNLNGSNRETLLTALDSPRGVALNFSEQKVYWTERSGVQYRIIRRSNFDGSSAEEYLRPNSSFPWDLGFR